MRPLWWLLLALVAWVAPAAHGQKFEEPKGARAAEIFIDGVRRTYRLFVPPGIAAAGKVPLVLVFHGGGGDGRSMEGLTKFSDLAQQQGFIVAYPEGIDHHWNDGRVDVQVQSSRVDDLAFIRALITEIRRLYPIDPQRIFATGMSNGAIFAHYLAANNAELIAAIAPVAGGIADPFHKRFNPKAPVSVLIMQGTTDPLMPYQGGSLAKGRRGKIISTDQAVQLWAKANGIAGQPSQARLPDVNTSDGCTVESYQWTGGKAGAEVTLYKQIGAGHTWPGGSQYMPPAFVGTVCRDINATSQIWSFFQAHPKR